MAAGVSVSRPQTKYAATIESLNPAGAVFDWGESWVKAGSAKSGSDGRCHPISDAVAKQTAALRSLAELWLRLLCGAAASAVELECARELHGNSPLSFRDESDTQ